MIDLQAFADRTALAEGAAELIAGALRAPGSRSFVATGGTTPGPAYDRLARADLDWSRITVTLSDERWVPADAPESNERLVRTSLLTDRAGAAHFLPLKGAGSSPQADASAAEISIAALLPFAAVLLGMGEDGHVGSLFPGAADLDAALNPDGERLCVGVAMSGEKPFIPRISLTVAAFLHSCLIVVLISGEAKRAVVGKVGADPAYDPPVAAVLRQRRVPAKILWAP